MNTEKLEKLKKSLDNKFIPDNMKDKIRAEIKKLEADIKTDETITATEVKEEVKEIEKKVEKALEVAEEKEEQAEAKAEEKKEKAPRKAREKKATQSETKTPKVEPKSTAKKKSVFSIAKEIRKDNESWEDAKERARKMMKSETTETKKKTRTETDKLLAMVRRNKEYKKLAGTSNLPKDASRRALPRGKRVSQGGWKNQYGESEGGKVYYENRANRVDVGGFKNAYLENGGYAEKGVYVETLDEEIDLTDDGIVKATKTQQGGNKSFGERREMHGASPEALAFDNGGSIEDEKFKKFINSQVSYIISLKTISQKREPIQNLLDNMEDYRSGSEIVKRITTDNLKYALQQKTVSKMNEVLRISLNALQYAEGGTIIGTPETPLARGLDIDYTGLVGETGGMSAGEMFAEGGSIENQYEGKTPSQIWSMLSVSQKYHFLEDHSKEIESTPMSIEKATKTAYKFLPTKIKKSFEHHVEMGQYAMGGSLGNHGLKQGDEIIKTMSGGVQKVKTKSGDIVYVNLANGYRGVTPPLPFAKGGYTNERRHVNKAQDYEVRYAKQRPNRTGYSGKRNFEEGGFMTDPNFGDFQNGVYAKGGVTKNYINRNQLNTITIKKGNQKLTYKVSDVYNGAYKLEDGGNLERTAFYVSKRNVVKVQLKDGKDVKVANGYWIKKGAKPIHTSKYDDGGMTEKGNNLDYKLIKSYWGNKKEEEFSENEFKKYIEKNEIKNVWIGYKKIEYFKFDSHEGRMIMRYSLKKNSTLKYYVSFLNHSVALKNNNAVFLEDINYEDYKNSILTKKTLDILNYKNNFEGGGSTTFKEKATAIAKNFEGKKVEPKYQKEYGKTYDKAEAKEVGNKIAGSQKAKYDSKMSGGGKTKRGGAMQLAKQIRKDGESWQSALKRANEQMRNK